MKQKLCKLLILILVAFLPAFAQNILACQCFGLPTPYEAFQNADTVFTGKVVGVTDKSGKKIIKDKSANPWDDYRSNGRTEEYYRFKVQESFKGEKKSELTVGVSINMCQFGFDLGDEILIYAYKGDDGLWTNIFCSRASLAKSDVYFLRDLLANKSEPRIYGSVHLSDKNLETSAYQETYLKGIKIIAQRGKRVFITFTDQNGLYRFNKLPDGKYKIYPKLQKNYAQDGLVGLREIILQKNREFPAYFKSFGPSAYSDFGVFWNNAVTGRVLDAEGKQLEQATVRLIQPNQVNDESLDKTQKIAGNLSTVNRKTNIRKYMEIGETPGKYILALEVFAPFESGQEKLRMYYPQTTDLDQAEIISLGESTHRDIDLQLPAGFLVRQITGSLLWKSGDPIKDGWVSIEKLENSDDKNNIVYDSQRVENRSFRFQVFENAEYWIHAKFDNEKAKPVKIKVRKTNEPVKIVISLLK